MRRRVIRWVLAGFLVLLAAAFPAAGIAFAGQQQSKAADSKGIDARDAEFLTVINYANLWEQPMGKLATERGTSEEVRTAGATMLSDHTKLDKVVHQLAAKWGVKLTDTPKSSHQGWMAEIQGKKGKDFDKTFVNRLRAAHGSVFGLIAEERAGTRNSIMRDFATQANTIVMKHMTLLEATGYMDSHSGEFAEAGARSVAYPENRLTGTDILVGAVIFLVVSAGTVLGVRLLSARGASS